MTKEEFKIIKFIVLSVGKNILVLCGIIWLITKLFNL